MNVAPSAGGRLRDHYAMDSYFGRLQYFSRVCDPRHLLTTDQQIIDARELLSTAVLTNRAVENARHVLAGTTDPATGEIIPAPFRMASWVAMGAAPSAGLVMMSQYFPTAILGAGFFQFCAQSVNAGITFFNGSLGPRGGFNNKTTNELFSRYSTSGCIPAVALTMGGAMVMRGVSNPMVTRYGPFPIIAAASCVNTAMVRRNEIEEGIMVTDDQGNPLGRSAIAAKKAVAETCVTRAVLPAGSFLVAPLLYTMASTRTLLLIRRPFLAIPVQVALSLGCFFVALPASLAIYDQRGTVNIRELEPHITEQVRAGLSVGEGCCVSLLVCGLGGDCVVHITDQVSGIQVHQLIQNYIQLLTCACHLLHFDPNRH
jgi:hypothetical protein